jgi:hypothetical protein
VPRMSKKNKLLWSLFLNAEGRRTCNEFCRKCIHYRKQSFKAIVIECPKYESKRSKSDGGI